MDSLLLHCLVARRSLYNAVLSAPQYTNSLGSSSQVQFRLASAVLANSRSLLPCWPNSASVVSAVRRRSITPSDLSSLGSSSVSKIHDSIFSPQQFWPTVDLGCTGVYTPPPPGPLHFRRLLCTEQCRQTCG